MRSHSGTTSTSRPARRARRAVDGPTAAIRVVAGTTTIGELGTCPPDGRPAADPPMTPDASTSASTVRSDMPTTPDASACASTVRMDVPTAPDASTSASTVRSDVRTSQS